MRAIVTGGLGFIGSCVVQELVRQNINTIVYDNLSTGSVENLSSTLSKIQVIEADILELDKLQSVMKGADYVFHLAAYTSVAGSVINPLLTYKINTEGTLNVLWAALQAKVSRVVIASSSSIYGDNTELPLRESLLPNPKSPYAASKLTSEALAESFYHSYGLETVCLRYFNVYGLQQKADSDYSAVIPRFIECYHHKKIPQIYGTGEQSRDFIHVSDVARANVLAATLPSDILRQNRVFNIGTGTRTNLLELLHLISSGMKIELKPKFLPSRQGDVEHSCADISLAQEKMKFRPLVNLAEGIESLL